MKPLPLNLCVFDSSKGHFGRTDIYQRTITDLEKQIPLCHFAQRFVHVKVAPGEESVFVEQEVFYRTHGFTVMRTDEPWSHFSPSHQTGYARDLVKVYGHPAVQKAPFTLHLESDWLFRPRKHSDLTDLFVQSMRYLEADHTALAVRFPRFLDEVKRLEGLNAKHGMNVRVRREEIPWGQFIRHSDNLSLNPSIFRTRDLYATTRLLKMHFGQLASHVEMGFTRAFDHLADGELPFAIIDPGQVSVLHIGTKAGEEDPEEGVYDCK